MSSCPSGHLGIKMQSKEDEVIKMQQHADGKTHDWYQTTSGMNMNLMAKQDLVC